MGFRHDRTDIEYLVGDVSGPAGADGAGLAARRAGAGLTAAAAEAGR